MAVVIIRVTRLIEEDEKSGRYVLQGRIEEIIEADELEELMQQ